MNNNVTFYTKFKFFISIESLHIKKDFSLECAVYNAWDLKKNTILIFLHEKHELCPEKTYLKIHQHFVVEEPPRILMEKPVFF